METITKNDYEIDIISMFPKGYNSIYRVLSTYLCLSFAALSEYPEFWGKSEVTLVQLIVSNENQDDMRS